MPGINRIKSEAADEKSQQSSSELWPKDGDEVFGLIVSDGNDDNDLRFDKFYTHSVQGKRDDGSNLWKNSLCPSKEEEVCKLCDKDVRPARKFGFWMYVNYILHKEKKNDSWEAVKKRASGEVQYKEDINDFRVFSHGFGSKDYLFNQVVDIFNEYGSLNKYVIRIKRTGSGMKDTSYAITSTTKIFELPKEMQTKVKELPGIREFFKKQWSPRVQTSEDNKDAKLLTQENDELGLGDIDEDPTESLF